MGDLALVHQDRDPISIVVLLLPVRVERGLRLPPSRIYPVTQAGPDDWRLHLIAIVWQRKNGNTTSTEHVNNNGRCLSSNISGRRDQRLVDLGLRADDDVERLLLPVSRRAAIGALF